MRIYDSFPFDGELDLLDHHLRECFDLVDTFVLIEAAETYRGEAKECVFDRNRKRFAWAAAKIRHVKLSSLGPGPTARNRAAVQRNAVMLALGDAAPKDAVLLLDVDEVPSRDLLQRLRADGLQAPQRLAMTRHYGFADALGPRSPCCPTAADPFAAAVPWVKPGRWDALADCWYGHSAVATPRAALAQCSPFDMRYSLPLGDVLREAGRHFSSVDPSTRLSRKLARVFHEEYDGPRERSPAHLERCRRHNVHHRGWWYAEAPSGPLPDDVARLLQAQPDVGMPATPAPLERRLVRIWACVRLWRRLPDPLVAAIDRQFERWRPLLAPPLLLLEVGRGLAARALRLAGRRPLRTQAHH